MADVESSIEGPIEKIESDGSGGVFITALGVRIHFIPSALGPNHSPRITSPTRSLIPLSVAELLDTTVLPGRSQPGFAGGTVIAEGAYSTTLNELLATSVNVEPGETVLIGALTKNNPGPPLELAINGTPIVMLQDRRLPANRLQPMGNPVFHNQYALPMKIESAIVANSQVDPLPSVVEGYYGTDPADPSKRVFYAFAFEYGDTGILLRDPVTTPQVSIERPPQFRDRGAAIEVEARGTLTTHHILGAPPVQLLRFLATDEQGVAFPLPGNLDLRFDEVEPGFTRWRLRDQYAKVGNLNRIPFKLQVENVSATLITGTPVTDEYEAEFREA